MVLRILVAALFVSSIPRLAQAAFDLELVDALGDAGRFNSLTLDSNGNGHVIYSRAIAGTCPPFDTPRLLTYAYQDGGAWIIDSIEDAPCPLAGGPSIVIDSNGDPHVLFQQLVFDGAAQIVHLIYGVRSGGVWSFETIETNERTGGSTPGFNDPRIELDASDVPHLSYGDVDPTLLKYGVRTGSSWTIEIVDDTATAGGYTDLALDSSGNPSISYFAYTGNIVRFAQKSGAKWSIEDVEASIDLFGCTSLQIDSAGAPRLAYSRPSGGLIYATKSGGAWTRLLVPVTAGFPTAEVELALDSAENPHIAFQDRTTQRLRYVFRIGNDWLLRDVDPSAVGDHCGISIGSGDLAHLSYYRTANDDLWHASSMIVADVSLPGILGAESRIELFPNPSREGGVAVLVSLDQGFNPGSANLQLIDTSGRLVRSLSPSSIGRGAIRFSWDAREGTDLLPGGIYQARVWIDGTTVGSTRWVHLR